MENNIDKYQRLLAESGLFWAGPTKGSLILPPQGYTLWKNIQTILDRKFSRRGVQNVLLPTLIPFDLLTKEKDHITGFSPECFYVEKIGSKKLTSPLVLRPTSEVIFYEWYRQILRSYQQLPFLYNQWCSVFRAEKNTNPFFRNTEFLWQEGHTLHISETEARQFALNILTDYQDYAENILCLAIVVGRKTEREKFAGALETYTIECLLPDGQCLQLATSHYFGDNFCRLMGINFQGSDPKKGLQFPFSTSWGTSTRALGALVKTHADNWGVILPFDIAPVQIAFILFKQTPELIEYYQEIFSLLIPYYRCRLYNKSEKNLLRADEEGCPLKIILGPKELKNREVTLIRRDDVERRMTIKLEGESELEKKIFSLQIDFTERINQVAFPDQPSTKQEEKKAKMVQQIQRGAQLGKLSSVINREAAEFNRNLYQKSVDFRDSHIYKTNSMTELEKKIKEGAIGIFLVPFCCNLECEEKIKTQVPAYSIRCIAEKEKVNEGENCLFCLQLAKIRVYLGRSY